MLEQPVIITPSTEHKATVIWLHGLGDSGHGFAPIVPELKLNDELGVKFIFPHAPVQPVTINNGMEMRAWYDIKSLDMESRADTEGVKTSANLIREMLDAEIASGIPSTNILLAGFSQGGVIALELGTRYHQSLGGILALSTYMSAPDTLSEQKSKANQHTPILMCHGQQDEVVPLFLGRSAYDVLKYNEYPVEWKEYIMQHNVCVPEIRDISKFITQQLS